MLPFNIILLLKKSNKIYKKEIKFLNQIILINL